MNTSASETPRTGQPVVPQIKTRAQIEEEIERRVQAERARLTAEAGVARAPVTHFQRPVERAFTAAERDKVTILFGGLTTNHERLIEAVFRAAGYKCQVLPTPDVASFQLGKEYGNNGQCNPTYFTVGHLIKYLQQLEHEGVPRQDIINNYVFFTAGSCGPCRFGMYEAEYRLAIENAGFSGFRVLLFQQNDGIKAATGEPGLKFTVDFGMGAFSALNFGDIMNDIGYQIRPFEVRPGETDRVMTESMAYLTARVQEREMFEILQRAPTWMVKRWGTNKIFKDVFNTLGKIRDHLYGPQTREALHTVRDRIGAIEVDRLRVKPIVKVTGEFWAQTTEGDGNFHMFRFLEREGAQVIVEPIGTWIMYMLWLAKAKYQHRRELNFPTPKGLALGTRMKQSLKYHQKLAGFQFGNWFWNHQYARVGKMLGGIAHHLVNLDELATLANPYYNVFARGGEGHMEVAKNIYYTVNKKCHMVLSLKPFGCMPSTQSDGVQSAVMNHFKDMIYLPIETSGEGEINAHSRVQMALGEAKAKAKQEFAQVLESTGKNLDAVRAYVAQHAELRHPLYPVPYRKGVTGTAATFVLHVNDLMEGRTRLRKVPGLNGRGDSSMVSKLRKVAAL
jgi:predicted nucleotide-binding protein (sugar kinase/HSP70/actin superfamily)